MNAACQGFILLERALILVKPEQHNDVCHTLASEQLRPLHVINDVEEQPTQEPILDALGQLGTTLQRGSA